MVLLIVVEHERRPESMYAADLVAAMKTSMYIDTSIKIDDINHYLHTYVCTVRCLLYEWL